MPINTNENIQDLINFIKLTPIKVLFIYFVFSILHIGRQFYNYIFYKFKTQSKYKKTKKNNFMNLTLLNNLYNKH